MFRQKGFYLLSIFLLLVLTIFQNSCNLEWGHHGSASSSSSSSTSVGGILYALDDSIDTVFVYTAAKTATGTITPVRTISGESTLIHNATTLAIDPTHNILYVADADAEKILVFNNASSRSGNVSPDKQFPGVKRAGVMYYDNSNDRLYVSDLTDQLIRVWDGVSGLGNNSTASRTLTLSYGIAGLFVDTTRNLLYVGNTDTRAINVYSDAGTRSGTITSATRSFTDMVDSANEFFNLNGIAINIENNILYVSESSNPSLEMFDNASTLSGEETRDRVLSGTSTTLSSDLKKPIFLNSKLYLQNATNKIISFENNLNQLSGNTAPTRTMTLGGTLSRIADYSIDETR